MERETLSAQLLYSKYIHLPHLCIAADGHVGHDDTNGHLALLNQSEEAARIRIVNGVVTQYAIFLKLALS